MTGPNSGLGDGGDAGGDGGGGGGGGAASINPFTKKSQHKQDEIKIDKEKIENKVRYPTCPNPEHKDEKIRMVNGGDNELLKCPKCKNIYDINGNKKGELQPLWESKEIK